jgi:hypothetical protein
MNSIFQFFLICNLQNKSNKQKKIDWVLEYITLRLWQILCHCIIEFNDQVKYLFFYSLGVQSTRVHSSFIARPGVDEIKPSEAHMHTAHKQLSHRTGKLELVAPQLLANQAVD